MGKSPDRLVHFAVHRLVLHATAALLLMAAAVFCWNRVHQPHPGGSTVCIPNGGPWINASSQAVQIDLPDRGAFDGLHIRFQLQADEIRRGPEEWQTARLHLEWLRDGTIIERVFLASAQDNQTVVEPAALLTRIPARATARLHVENLGLSGRCRLLEFESFPTRTLPIARITMLAIATGWLFWAAATAGPLRCTGSWLAAAVWVGSAYALVLPGPWTTRSPLVGEFVMDSVEAPAQELPAEAFAPAPCHPGNLEAPNLLLRWKVRLRFLRPLLHSLLFFAPALVFLLLTRAENRALALVAMLAVLVELAQWAFGYGFEVSDCLDLGTDAIGILLALVLHRRWRRHRARATQG